MKKNKRKITEVLILIIMILTITICCDEYTEDACNSNIDCYGKSVCEGGVCVRNSKYCNTIGIFEEVAVTEPKNATKIDNIHVTFDGNSAVHYCYTGKDKDRSVSYYGKQTDENDFIEKEILIENASIECAAIVVNKNDVPFIFSKKPMGIVTIKENSWIKIELDGINSDEMKSAIRSFETIVSLSMGRNDEIYVSISMGYNMANQSIYIAEIKDKNVGVLLNGWTEKGEPTVVGYAPQVIESVDGIEFVLGRRMQNNIVLVNEKKEIENVFVGEYPKVSSKNQKKSYMIYRNNNNSLILKEKINNKYKEIGKISGVNPQKSRKGNVPWDLAIDQHGTSHILYENRNLEGENVLIYQYIKSNGEIKKAEIVTDDISQIHVGNQLYDIETDVCNKPVIVSVESNIEKKEEETETNEKEIENYTLPKIKIRKYI